jgi:hypothetical protein
MQSSKLTLFLAASTLERLRNCKHANIDVYDPTPYDDEKVKNVDICLDCGSLRFNYYLDARKRGRWTPPSIWADKSNDFNDLT